MLHCYQCKHCYCLIIKIRAISWRQHINYKLVYLSINSGLEGIKSLQVTVVCLDFTSPNCSHFHGWFGLCLKLTCDVECIAHSAALHVSGNQRRGPVCICVCLCVNTCHATFFYLLCIWGFLAPEPSGLPKYLVVIITQDVATVQINSCQKKEGNFCIHIDSDNLQLMSEKRKGTSASM